LFGLVAYWLVILATLIIAFNGLGLTYITDLLGRVVLFAPKLLVAMLIVIFGSYCARFVGGAVHSHCVDAQIPDADMLGRIARYLIMTFVVMIALSQVEIGGDIVQRTFLILLAGLVLAFALAFGLGGIDRTAISDAKFRLRDAARRRRAGGRHSFPALGSRLRGRGARTVRVTLEDAGRPGRMARTRGARRRPGYTIQIRGADPRGANARRAGSGIAVQPRRRARSERRHRSARIRVDLQRLARPSLDGCGGL
jgi:type IV secretory pathway TrbL component